MQHAFETCGENEYCFIQLKLHTKCGAEDSVLLYIAQMVRCLSVFSDKTVKQCITVPEMECLDSSCSMSDNEDNKRTVHAASNCEGCVRPAELLECSR
jgi:hypothetical protein